MRTNRGVTLIELILAITIIAVGVLPLLSAMAQVSEAAIIQKDLMSAMTIGKTQMDSWLHRFQAADTFLSNGASAYPGSPDKIIRPVPSTLIHFNDAFYSTETLFTLMNGVNEIRCAQSTLSSSPKLSSAERVVYHICVRVWKINNVVTDSEGVGRLTPGIDSPGFEHGDELLYELASLYSQTDSIHRLSLAESP